MALARHGIPWGKTAGEFNPIEAVAYLEEHGQQEHDAYEQARAQAGD